MEQSTGGSLCGAEFFRRIYRRLLKAIIPPDTIEINGGFEQVEPRRIVVPAEHTWNTRAALHQRDGPDHLGLGDARSPRSPARGSGRSCWRCFRASRPAARRRGWTGSS